MSMIESQLAIRPIILASASASRLALLTRAGLAVTAMPARIDEEAIRYSMVAEGATPRDIADMLAELKALQISQKSGDTCVVGADQILVCEKKIYAKATNRAEAFAQLTALSGKPHELVTAICVAQNGHIIWRTVETPRLVMRPLRPSFIDAYLDAAGETVLSSVGVYHLEGLGAQLFSKVEGDYFSILGLPLIALLDFLRRHNIVAL